MDIATNKAIYSIINELGIIINKELRDELSRLEPPNIHEDDAVRFLRSELTDDEILESISSCIALGLGITSQCNFRCLYCVYSGNYSGERTHSNKKMDINISKKAVDLFFQLLLHKRRKNKIRTVSIGFYGGECLTEFETLKDTIHYAESKAVTCGAEKIFDISFRVTTNGYLLDNEEIIDFLRDRNVMVDVSLDGPEKEHDKFRLTRQGGKTWARILDNIKKIKDRYPQYYETNFKYLVTLHPDHDVKAIEQFFLNNSHLFKIEKLRFNRVNLIGLNEEIAFKLRKATQPIGDLQYLQLEKEIEQSFHFRTRTPGMNFTGTCFPGGVKIFVDSDGNLNVCESIIHSAPKLGDVEKGLDFDSIRKIIRDYNEEIIKNRCWECDSSLFCDMCIAKAYQNGKGLRFECTSRKADFLFLKKFLEEREKEDEKKYFDINNPDIAAFMDRL